MENLATVTINGQTIECLLVGERDSDSRATVWVCEKSNPDNDHIVTPGQIQRIYYETR